MRPIRDPIACVVTGRYSLGFFSCGRRASLSPKGTLGKLLFFDTNLIGPLKASPGAGLSTGLKWGFTGSDEEINKAVSVYEGAVKGRFGNRKPPASSYGETAPSFISTRKRGSGWVACSGSGDASDGAHLRDPLAEQAQGPFLNPLETEHSRT